MEFLGALMNSENTLEILQAKSGRASIFGTPFHILRGDRIRINDNIYVSTPEIYKVFSSTSYSGKNMKDENDVLMMNNIGNVKNYTGVGDKSSE